jgi:hypothetical protein
MEAQLTERGWVVKPELSLVHKVAEVEKKLLSVEQADCPLYHHFGPGLYIREVHIPAGTMAMGHHQRLPHMNVMIKGRVIMLNEDGTSRELVAPRTFMAPPGRKVGYVLEDVVWQNIYPTDETDVEVLEATYLDKSEYSVEYKKNADRIRSITHNQDREDYSSMLDEFGFTEEIARMQSENESDQITMPYGWSKATVRDSTIEGKGFFANAPLAAGEVIAPALVGDMRTPAGRYTNHSMKPNAEMVKRSDGDVDLVALVDISGCKGGSIGDEITVDYRQAILLSKYMEVE